eukprot:14831432-Heterocapsa_arctica.AAC.1
MRVSPRRELGFEAVILKRAIISNPKIRLAPRRNYYCLLGVESSTKYVLDANVVQKYILPWRELGFEAVILKRVIRSSPKIRLAPRRNYYFELALN